MGKFNVTSLILAAFVMFTLANFGINASTCSQGFKIKKEHLNKRLIPYTFLEVTVASHHDCARECFNFGGECKAINYNRKNKYCELKYKGSDSVDVSEFEQDGEYIFSDITEWPKSMMGGCAAHNCQDHQVCLPLGHSDFQCVDKENCGPAPTIDHGTVSAPITTDGAAATYSCNFGYEIVGDVTTRRCKDERWTEETIACALKDCGPLADVTYGTVSAPVTTHGASGTYSCQYGYGFTSGDTTRTCVDGVWSGEQPTCTIKDCGYLPGISDGSVNTPVTTHGAMAAYECDVGFLLTSGDSTRLCDDGTWNGAEAVCTPIPNVGCYTVGYSYLYEGVRQYSQSGYLCQRWDAQSPHSHNRNNPASFPDDTLLAAENYCRDPDSTGYPWCYTTDPGVRFESCGVQLCK